MNKACAVPKEIYRPETDVVASISQSVGVSGYYFIGSIVLGLIVAGMELLARQWSKPFVLSVLLMPFYPSRPIYRKIPMPHPGLKDEFLDAFEMSVYALAKESASRGAGSMTFASGTVANIAWRLAKLFNVGPQWLTSLQAKHDLHPRGRGAEDLSAAT